MNRQLQPPTAFHQKKEPHYALNGRVGECQTPSGRFRVEEFLLTLSGIQPRFLGLIAHILDILLTSLSKLPGLMWDTIILDHTIVAKKTLMIIFRIYS